MRTHAHTLINRKGEQTLPFLLDSPKIRADFIHMEDIFEGYFNAGKVIKEDAKTAIFIVRFQAVFAAPFNYFR